MSNTYQDLYYTQFPDETDIFDYLTDITNDMLPYVKAYQNYITQGDFNSASQIIIEHPEIKRALINADVINKLIDGIKSSQRLYKDDIQSYIMNLVSYKGEYSSSVRYTKYDVISYNNQAYMCISNSATIGTLPTNNLYFIPLSLKGEQGVAGLGLSFIGTWSAKNTYSKDNTVSYNNKLFASKVDDNNAHTPSDGDFWTLVMDFNQITNYENNDSELNATTMQNAITEVANKAFANEDSIENLAQKVNSISAASLGLGNVNNTADSDKNVAYSAQSGNADSVDGIHFHPSDTSGAINGFGYVYGFNGGNDYHLYTCPTSQISVNYANSAGSAPANGGNSDTVDGFHIMASTSELVSGVSALGTNVIYIQYE